MCFLLAFFMSTRLFFTSYKALCITQGHVTSTHISNSQSNSGTNCIHQQSLNNCSIQIDARFMEVDIEISLWRWLVTLVPVAVCWWLPSWGWLLCEVVAQTGDKHTASTGPVYPPYKQRILYTVNWYLHYVNVWWGNKENTLHCVVLHFHTDTEFNRDHRRTHYILVY